MMIRANCHCGAVELEIARPPDNVTECNCSICRRMGAHWAYYAPREVKVIARSGATTPYVWGDRTIAFHHCKTCGCMTHWLSLGQVDIGRMGVNARLMDPQVVEGVRLRKFDGAVSWTYGDDA
jgi:hypothetical protein